MGDALPTRLAKLSPLASPDLVAEPCEGADFCSQEGTGGRWRTDGFLFDHMPMPAHLCLRDWRSAAAKLTGGTHGSSAIHRRHEDEQGEEWVLDKEEDYQGVDCEEDEDDVEDQIKGEAYNDAGEEDQNEEDDEDDDEEEGGVAACRLIAQLGNKCQILGRIHHGDINDLRPPARP